MLVALALLISALATPPDVSERALDDAALKLDSRVSELVVAGGWEDRDRVGRYRLVVFALGWEHVSSRVYLQWVEEVQDKQEARVLRSIPVADLNSGFVNVQNVSVIAGERPTFVIVTLNPYMREERETFRLEPTKLGEYSLRKDKR